MRRTKSYLIGPIILGICIVLTLAGNGRNSATAVSYPFRPGLPPGPFVTRIYYNNLADINRLAEYDVWEYNNQEQGYVLVSLYGSDYERLEKEGWILAIDEAETARLRVTGHSPFDEGYQRVDELYRSLETINEQYPMLSELVQIWRKHVSVRRGVHDAGWRSDARF